MKIQPVSTLLERWEEPVMRPVKDAKWLEAEAYLRLAETPGSPVSQVWGLLAFSKWKRMMDLKLTGCSVLNSDLCLDLFLVLDVSSGQQRHRFATKEDKINNTTELVVGWCWSYSSCQEKWSSEDTDKESGVMWGRWSSHKLTAAIISVISTAAL